MQAYLAAHDDFIAWLDDMQIAPAPAEVERRLRGLALTAANRGMTSTHWTFVVDGLIAYVNRRSPGDTLICGYLARGFDFCSTWKDIQREAIRRRRRVRTKET
jgi:hypothetical protein